MPQIEPQQRLAARLAILGNPDAQDCTVYRPDDEDPDAEELDLGDAKILFSGAFQAPGEWDEFERAEFFGDVEPELFVTAYIECEAKPDAAGFFVADVGDYVATMPGLGEVVMFFVHDYSDAEQGRHYTLIRDDEALD
ncbi:hypothetical protein P8H27_00095 [Pseudomonas sp. sp1636]|uniref:hypothetical protein n=1 Tax=Pseudomonas sp. sp1636 TaxID=3036707 RepID=UPI0025A5E87B|nr:hypothetical protein [Pseudomonas sp. sp1636]MDM8347304.1 hypothetical protein [Pseudomonas sp. sp1636]